MKLVEIGNAKRRIKLEDTLKVFIYSAQVMQGGQARVQLVANLKYKLSVFVTINKDLCAICPCG